MVNVNKKLLNVKKNNYFNEIFKNGFDSVKSDSGLCHEVGGEYVGDGQETVADRQGLVEHGVGPGINSTQQKTFQIILTVMQMSRIF